MVVGICCKSGQHRSVAFTQRLLTSLKWTRVTFKAECVDMHRAFTGDGGDGGGGGDGGDGGVGSGGGDGDGGGGENGFASQVLAFGRTAESLPSNATTRVKKVRGEFRSCEVCGIKVESADVWNEHIRYGF